MNSLYTACREERQRDALVRRGESAADARRCTRRRNGRLMAAMCDLQPNTTPTHLIRPPATTGEYVTVTRTVSRVVDRGGLCFEQPTGTRDHIRQTPQELRGVVSLFLRRTRWVATRCRGWGPSTRSTRATARSRCLASRCARPGPLRPPSRVCTAAVQPTQQWGRSRAHACPTRWLFVPLLRDGRRTRPSPLPPSPLPPSLPLFFLTVPLLRLASLQGEHVSCAAGISKAQLELGPSVLG
jgi:hypothetical protein